MRRLLIVLVSLGVSACAGVDASPFAPASTSTSLVSTAGPVAAIPLEPVIVAPSPVVVAPPPPVANDEPAPPVFPPVYLPPVDVPHVPGGTPVPPGPPTPPVFVPEPVVVSCPVGSHLTLTTVPACELD